MAMRFNPPPGWPPVPPGWQPPPGWTPDPSWPPAPHGWPLWVQDTPDPGPSSSTPSMSGFSLSSLTVASRWAIGGGAAVFLGSLLPFISSSDITEAGIKGGARVTSGIFALILVGLGAATQFAPIKPGSNSRPRGYAIALVILSVLGFLGYTGFAAIGAVGTTQTDALGFSATVTYSPDIGLIMAILGCAAAAVGAILVLRQGRQRQY
jgi:hypothetical protein